MEKEHFMNNQKGLSLLEVLISITILSIITMSILAFFYQAYDYTNRNEDNTIGINVARNALYYLEQQDYEQVKKTYYNMTDDDFKNLSVDSSNQPISCTDPLFTNNLHGDCADFFIKPEINNIPVRITATIQFPDDPDDPYKTKDPKDNQLKYFLFPVKVTATWEHGKTTATATVEGVIKK